jgi:hypothetical protein
MHEMILGRFVTKCITNDKHISEKEHYFHLEKTTPLFGNKETQFIETAISP